MLQRDVAMLRADSWWRTVIVCVRQGTPVSFSNWIDVRWRSRGAHHGVLEARARGRALARCSCVCRMRSRCGGRTVVRATAMGVHLTATWSCRHVLSSRLQHCLSMPSWHGGCQHRRGLPRILHPVWARHVLRLVGCHVWHGVRVLSGWHGVTSSRCVVTPKLQHVWTRHVRTVDGLGELHTMPGWHPPTEQWGNDVGRVPQVPV